LFNVTAVYQREVHLRGSSS